MWIKLMKRAFVRQCLVRRFASTASKFPNFGPSLKDFLVAGKNLPKFGVNDLNCPSPYLVQDFNGNNRKVRRESPTHDPMPRDNFLRIILFFQLLCDKRRPSKHPSGQN